MEKAPYTPSPKNVKKFFKDIQTLGIPSIVNQPYLKSIKYTSSYDNPLVGVCKFLGFVDSTGKPTDVWTGFRDKDKAPKVMADAIKATYDELYQTFPNADKRDDATLQNYFASRFGVAAKTANYMVLTFKYLCEFADFEAVAVTEPTPKPAVPVPEQFAEVMTGAKPYTININIQLQLPATEDATIYDSLFSALKRHLIS